MSKNKNPFKFFNKKKKKQLDKRELPITIKPFKIDENLCGLRGKDLED